MVQYSTRLRTQVHTLHTGGGKEGWGSMSRCAKVLVIAVYKYIVVYRAYYGKQHIVY